MAAGIPVTRADVNQRVGALALQVRNTLTEVRTVKRWFDDHDDASLVSLGLAQPDIDLLRATVNDLDKLARIATAGDVQVAPNDFFFNGRNVVGLA